MLRERRSCGLEWVDGKILEGKHKFEWQKGPIPRGNGVKKSEGRELVSQLTMKQWSVWTWDTSTFPGKPEGSKCLSWASPYLALLCVTASPHCFLNV